MEAVYGFVNPASGCLTESQRETKGSLEVLIRRSNFQEHEKIACPKCNGRKDILVVSIKKVKTFFNCPCSHNWTKDCDCYTKAEGSDKIEHTSSNLRFV